MSRLLGYSLISGLMLASSWPVNGLTPLIFASLIPLLFVEDIISNDDLGKKNLRLFFYSYVAFLTWNIATTWWIVYTTLPGAIFANVVNSSFYSIIFLLYSRVKRKIDLKAGTLFLITFWISFEKFHLKGFDDMPDTDYMEKVIKLRSTPKEQDYLTGGNVGFDKSLRSPWKLTRKGQIYAEEAERIFSGETEAPANTKTETKKTSHSFENTFRSIWQSDLYHQFTENQIPESVDEILACATLDMNYSPRRFSDDFNRKISNYENDLKAFEKDISDKRIEVTRKFLAWLKKEVK